MLSFPTLGLGASELRGLGIATATLVVTASTAFAQNTLTVKGVVKDTKGEALIGVNVRVKGTSQGASTDIDGKFSISGVARNAVLEVSYVGMQTLTVPVNGQTQHSITLKDDSNQLSDVVVVGYTTQRRESLTGSMLNIKSDKLKDITSPSVENLLNGKAPGVYVAPGSGQPGSSGAVVIRGQATLSGTTQPLWVIDGVIVGSNAGQLNPSDIESITVLKDAASTAIYGSQGANGVVVVTTKGARSGKIKISLESKAGVSALNTGNLRMMNGAELYDYYSSFADQSKIKFTRWTPELRNSNFDWWDLATTLGVTQDYNVSLQGGSEQISSLFTLGYYNEKGAVRGYDFTRYTARGKMSFRPTKWLTVKPAFNAGVRKVDDRQYSVGSMYSMLPWDAPYDEAGKLVPHRYSGWVNGAASNYLYDLQWNHGEGMHYELMGNLDFDIKLKDWLTLSSVNNVKYTHTDNHGYQDPRSNAGKNVDGRITEYSSEMIRRYTNQKILINKSWAAHRLDALLAYEYNDYYSKTLDVYGTGFLPGFEVLDVTAKPERAKGGISEWATQSYFANAKYSYDYKYFAEAMIRRDGASNFGDNAKYGNFYSVSGAWVINKEKWFKAPWVSNLKLRASYGTVGNRPSSLYPQYDLYAVSVKYNEDSGALIAQIGNKDLTWEETLATGLGLDAAFFDNRLRLTLDLYSKRTNNILYNVPISGLTGVTSMWRNIGSMSNRGFELALGGDIIRTKDWTWSLDFNLGTNSNKLLDLYRQKDEKGEWVLKPVIIGDGSDIAGSAGKILEVGEPIDTYYMPEWAGVDPKTGSPLWYKDNDQGERITTKKYAEAKYYKVGSQSPKVFGGFSTSLQWRDVDFSASFGYALGGQIYNYSRQEYDSDGTYTDRNQMALMPGWSRWQKEGDIATHPIAKYNNQDKGNGSSSRYLEDASFLKLRSLQLGYNITVKKWGLQSLRISLTGENLWTLSKYSGVDPELPASGGSVRGTSTPSVYPSVRRFMLGLSATF